MPDKDNILWFAASARNGQWKKIGRTLSGLGVEHYIPAAYNTLVFLHTTKSTALSLVNSGEIKARFIIDHGTHTLLTVPRKQMDDFIRVMDLSPDAECMSDVPLVKGGRVRVVKGALSGVEGEIISLPAGQYLIVRVSTLLCAKVEMPKSHVVAIPEEE